MKSRPTIATIFAALLMFQAASLHVAACAVCYGASDSPLAEGMNWGIMTLLAVIGSVLAGVVAFFVHAARKGAGLKAANAQGIQTEQMQ